MPEPGTSSGDPRGPKERKRVPRDPRVEPPAFLSPPRAGSGPEGLEPPPVATPTSPRAREKGNAGSPFVPPEPAEPPREE
eukprot:7068922-Alexandrium_andersonii.AAC.1